MVKMLPLQLLVVRTEAAPPIRHEDLVESELMDLLAPLNPFFRDSQRAMELRVSWVRPCCFKTSMVGTKTVKNSSSIMETAILLGSSQIHIDTMSFEGFLAYHCGGMK